MSDCKLLNENNNIYDERGTDIIGPEKINEKELDLLDSDDNADNQECLRLRRMEGNGGSKLCDYLRHQMEGNTGSKSCDYLRHHRKVKPATEYDVFHQEQIEMENRVVTWKAMGYAICLFAFGTSVLIAWYFISTSYIDKEQYVDNLQPFTLFVSLILIPGSYRIYSVFKEYFNTPGYSFENIIDCD